MKIIKETQPKMKRRCPLETARIEVLRARIGWRRLYLNADEYRLLRDKGLSKSDVDHAVDAMVESGDAVIESTHAGVLVRLVGVHEGGE
jgi:hypothetical protein